MTEHFYKDTAESILRDTGRHWPILVFEKKEQTYIMLLAIMEKEELTRANSTLALDRAKALLLKYAAKNGGSTTRLIFQHLNGVVYCMSRQEGIKGLVTETVTSAYSNNWRGDAGEI